MKKETKLKYKVYNLAIAEFFIILGSILASNFFLEGKNYLYLIIAFITIIIGISIRLDYEQSNMSRRL